MAAKLTMVPVSSSNLAAVGYDSATSVLHVEFKNGSIYEYRGVPNHLVDSLLTAESVGSFFNQNIKAGFPYSKV